jgi:hypothetical protein
VRRRSVSRKYMIIKRLTCQEKVKVSLSGSLAQTTPGCYL